MSKSFGYDMMALVSIFEPEGDHELVMKGKMIHLIATINPDANEPLQGESYGEEWTVSCEEAASLIRSHEGWGGFWKLWTDISGTVCGGIDLYDGMADEEADAFMRVGEVPELYGDDLQLATLVTLLPPGEYLLHVEPKQPAVKSKQYIILEASNITARDADMELRAGATFETWSQAQTAMEALARKRAEGMDVDVNDKANFHLVNSGFCIYSGPDYCYGCVAPIEE